MVIQVLIVVLRLVVMQEDNMHVLTLGFVILILGFVNVHLAIQEHIAVQFVIQILELVNARLDTLEQIAVHIVVRIVVQCHDVLLEVNSFAFFSYFQFCFCIFSHDDQKLILREK